MHQKENRAVGGSTGAVGNDALAGSGVRSPYSESRRLNLVCQPQAAGSSRRLVGSRYAAACPDTVMAAAFLDALKRREAVR